MLGLLFLFRENNSSYYEERTHLSINERRKHNGFSTTLIELMMTARQKESSPMEVQTSSGVLFVYVGVSEWHRKQT